MANALPLRIFLASPSDIDNERQIVRICVEEFNARRGEDSKVVFDVVGWDRVRGTARRPQSAINELIGESHYMIALFKSAWGSEPGSPWGYTSGTEEELFTGLLELGRREQPMRDIWVGFLDAPAPASEIVELRIQMSKRHSMMYESIADGRDLKEKLTARLEAWAESAGHKAPRQVDLLPSSGRDVLRAANLRLNGEKLVELGQPEAGVVALKEAAVLGGPDEQLAYARFLARHGEFDKALAATQKAIEFFSGGAASLESPPAAEAFAAQAGVLRRKGRDLDAIGRLSQALTLVSDPDPYAERVRGRILDELGLAHQKIGDVAAAQQNFEAALELRREHGRESDICQSLINLARVKVSAGELEAADSDVSEVLLTLRGSPPTALHANAEVLAAQVRLRQGRPDEGVVHATRAFALNEQIASKNGEAIALLLLAQCYRAAGDYSAAAEHAQACLELNDSMGNAVGAQRAQWLLDQLEEQSSANSSSH